MSCWVYIRTDSNTLCTFAVKTDQWFIIFALILQSFRVDYKRNIWNIGPTLRLSAFMELQSYFTLLFPSTGGKPAERVGCWNLTNKQPCMHSWIKVDSCHHHKHTPLLTFRHPPHELCCTQLFMPVRGHFLSPCICPLKWMNENLYLVHANFHTKPCMFTVPDTHSAYM